MNSFKVVLIKIPASYFVDINKLILKFIWRDKIPCITNLLFEKKSKVERFTLLYFKTYFKATDSNQDIVVLFPPIDK